MSNDLLTCAGSAIKAVDRLTVAGHAVIFTNPYDTDRENDFFTKSTDFDLSGRVDVSGHWHHNLDPTVPDPLGRATFRIEEEGIFAQLKLRDDETGQRVFKLAEADGLAWSSGSAQHLVRREKVGNANWIRRWPITEFSVLPRKAAAEPRAVVRALKSLSDALPLSPEQRARKIQAEMIKSRYERQRREFERSLHQDDQSEMADYYDALSRLELAKCELRRRRLGD